MARIKVNNYPNTKSYYIIEDYKRNGKRTTKVVESIGNYETISNLAKKDNMEVDAWLTKHLEEYKKNKGLIIEEEKVIIEKYTNKLISKNKINKFNIGYLFVEDLYYALGLNRICKKISEKYKFEFDLNEVLSYLIYSRVIFPASKLKTYELSKNFIEPPKYELINLYRGLTYLNMEMNYIQKELYNNSKSIVDRTSNIYYYDVTNYYFDIYEEDDLRKYTANSKDKKSKPVVGMGLFLDGNGFPIAMNIFPGNTNEGQTLIPLEEVILGGISENGTVLEGFDIENKKIITCTDAAMCTDKIKKFNVKDGRAFVITQSLKKLKDKYKEEVFNDSDWRILGDLKHIYKLSDILNDDEKSTENYNTIFYKIIQTETQSVKQDLIVTFQIKYREYQRKVRQGQIERAKKKIKENDKNKRMKLATSQNDCRRFIQETITTINGDVIIDENQNSLNKKEEENYLYSYSINQQSIVDEELYDGYYGLTTNLSGEISEILKIAKSRWEIEENFRMLKTDFDSGTVYLSKADRIAAHFLTCYITLLIYRILENKLNYKYTNTQILEKLREMEMYEEKGAGYSPAYVRNDLTDDLHELFGFRTDYEIVNYKKIEEILKKVKK